MVGINDRRREWLENITQLKKKKEQELKNFEEKKKKELAELEEKKKNELEEAEEMLKAGVEDLSDEEEQTIEHLREIIPELKELEQEKTLEETISQEKVSEEIKQGPAYEIPIDEIVSQVYQQTNYNVYNELKGALEKVQRGDYLNQQERETIYKRQDEINKLDKTLESDPVFLREKDEFGYIDRSKQVLDSIEKSLHASTQYKTGDHT
ncbi:hypothetical protein ACFLTH_05680 [Bacteroidota bacterium]